MSLPPSGPPNPPEPEPTWLPEPEAPAAATSALPPYDPQFGPRPYETAAGQGTPYGQQPPAPQPQPQYAPDPYAAPQQPAPSDPFADLYGRPAAPDPYARPAQPPAAPYGGAAEPQYPTQQFGQQYAQPQYAEPQYEQPQYEQPSYARPQYEQQYADPQYADPQPQDDPRQPDPYAQYGQQYAQPAEQYEGYSGPQYGAPQYGAPQYAEPQYDQQYADPQYADPYAQQYPADQYPAQPYPAQEYGQQYGQQYGRQDYAEPQYGDRAPADPYGRPEYDPYARQQQFADPFPLGGGQQPYYPPEAPRRTQKTGTNGFAIAGFVFSVIGGLLFSVVFSVIGLRQIRRDGGKGRGLAIAGLVLSGLWVVGLAAVFAFGLFSSVDRGPSGEVVAPGDVALTDLRVGDCVESWSESDSVTSVRLTPCVNAHDAQVVSADALPAAKGSAYPGDAALDDTASTMCTKTVDGLDDAKLPSKGLSVAYFRPLADSWKNGDRTVTCLVVADAPMKGTVLS